MAFLRHLKATDGLSDPKGSLSSSIQPQAIAQANEEVRVARYSGLINFCTGLLCLKYFYYVNFLHETFVTRKFPNLWYIVLCLI